MKRNVFAITIIGMLLLSSFAFGPIITGAPPQQPSNGDILYVGGVGSGNYSNIQDAINASFNGDTVFVYNGIYYENIVVNKTIDLLGENTEETIIDGGGIGDVVELTANNTNISGFTIRHPGPISDILQYAEIEEGESIYYYPANDIIKYHATRFSPEGSCKLTTCSLQFLNTFSSNNTDDGINVTVWEDDGNGYPDLSQERARINVPSSDIKWIEDDEWTEVDFSAYDLIFTDDFFVGSNTFDLNEDYYAIVIDNTTDEGINRSSHYEDGNWYPEVDPAGPYYYNYLIKANVTFSGIGLNLTGSNKSIIKENMVTHCEKGIFVHGICNDNKIYHNNLIDNTQNAYDAGSNTWNNETEGNYWDDYTGEVNDGYGMGDTPFYTPGENNQDLYPLMEPYGEEEEEIEVIITIEDELPANNSVDIDVYQPDVNVYILAYHLQHSSGVSPPIAFNWTIEGEYIENTGADYDSAGIKTANLLTPLPSLTEIIWYVNVTANELKENKIFYFTTEGYNAPPVANFTHSINDLTVTFNASSSYDPEDGTIIAWNWTFGDGTTGNGMIVEHNYTDKEEEAIYTVELTVTDNGGKTDNISKDIGVVNNLPIANFTCAIDGKTVSFDASNSSDENGTIVSYFWDFGDETNGTGIEPKHEYAKDCQTYEVILTVTDSAGAFTNLSKDITIDDGTEPTVDIVKPVKKGVYINNEYKISRIIGIPLIIGDITIEVKATDENGSGVKQVNFIIDDFRTFARQDGNATEPNDDGLYTWTWDKDVIFRFLHVHTIKVEVEDNAENIRTSDTMLVRRFL